MISPYIVDQEKALDTAVKNVKCQAYHILLTIEQNNLRFCLKQSKIMLNELRTDILQPKNYYQLYNSIFDEMKKIEDFMKLEITHGRKPEDIYESVQQCQFVIPRLYLTIIAGSIYIENCPSKCTELLSDLLEMVRLAQNPLRGIFARFFLLQIIKDKLPDNDNIYVKEKGGNLTEAILFLVKNFEEINRLWIRISSDASEVDKTLKVKEREDLKPLISETINRLSSLEGVTLEIYENLVLPKLIEIVFMYNDPLSQEYIMECIIRAFPVEYNIKCMEFILLTISKLTEKVNIKLLFIIMLVKLTCYIDSIRKIKDEKEKEKLIQDAYSIYPILMRNFDIIINNELRNEMKVLLDILELNISFVKYTIKCAPEKDQLNSINHILNLSVNILMFFPSQNLLKNEIDKICELLSIPLESPYSLFAMPDFPKIMNCLDYYNMKKLGLSIINNLINPNSKEKINSIEKLDQLFLFIRPLLKNIISTEEENDVNFEKEQNTVAKLIFVIKSKDPEILYDIYTKLRYTLYEGGKKRLIITYPALANALIHICQQLTFSYENKDKEVEEDENTIDFYDISKFESDDLFYEFLSKVYDFLSDIINTVGEIIPQLGIKLNLLALSQVNNVNVKAIREKLEEKSLLFFNNCMNAYKAYDKEKRFDLFIDICQKLLEIDIINKEKLESIFKELFSEAKSMPKRTDQCNGLLIISQLYYKHFKDSKKIVECLNAAKRVADFSLTNPHNLILYVLLLNKYIYYVDVDEENIAEIKSEQIEDLVEAIKNHIITIKTDKNIDASFLPEIENYFKNTVALIELRKKEEKHKEIYDSINISSS